MNDFIPRRGLSCINKLSAILLFFLFSYVVLADGSPVKLQILATSDTHGRFLPYDYASASPDNSGSLAQIYTIVKKLRAECPDTLLVDDGDILQDNFQFLFMTDKGSDEINPMIKAMNLMGYDLINLGNHEFNTGVPILVKTMSKFRAADGNPDSVLCANLYTSDGKRLFAPYKIVTTKNGVKVAFIGTVSQNIARWDTKNLMNYKVTDPVEETKKIADELRGKVDVLVAISHMGLEEEYGVKDSGIIDLAAACPDLDLIICGHFHVILSDSYYFNGKLYSGKDVTADIRNKGLLIVEPYCFGKGLSQVVFTLTPDNGHFVIKDKDKDVASKFIPVGYTENGKKAFVLADPEIARELASFDKTAKDYGASVIGSLEGGSLVPANGIKDIPQCFLKPTPLTYLLNIVCMYYGSEIAGGKKIDVGACTILSKDSNICEGNIKRSDIAKIYKYFNTLYVIRVSGAQLKKFMEWSAEFYNQYKPGDLTISFNPDRALYTYVVFNGVSYKIDISKPAGERITDLKKADGSPVKDDDVLLLATNSYMGSTSLVKYGSVFKEGETLPELVACSEDNPAMSSLSIKDLIEKYITEVKGGKIKADSEDNWEITGTSWDKELHDKAVKLVNEGKIKIPSNEKSFNGSPITADQVR